MSNTLTLSNTPCFPHSTSRTIILGTIGSTEKTLYVVARSIQHRIESSFFQESRTPQHLSHINMQSLRFFEKNWQCEYLSTGVYGRPVRRCTDSVIKCACTAVGDIHKGMWYTACTWHVRGSSNTIPHT